MYGLKEFFEKMTDYYFHVYKRVTNEFCANCRNIDESVANVNYADDSYHGYDGTAFCDESKETGFCISPCWKACSKFTEKTSEDYKKDLVEHILYALANFPEGTEAKDSEEHVFNNVISHYDETLKILNIKEIYYKPELYSEFVNRYREYDKFDIKKTTLEYRQKFYNDMLTDATKAFSDTYLKEEREKNEQADSK